jgi:hypothetical protein
MLLESLFGSSKFILMIDGAMYGFMLVCFRSFISIFHYSIL